MSSPVPKPQAASQFKRWRRQCDLTQQQAADLLHLSRRTVQTFDEGVSQHTGEPISPPYVVRIAMRYYVVDGGNLIEPWPDQLEPTNA